MTAKGKVGAGWLASSGKIGNIDFKPKKQNNPRFLSSDGKEGQIEMKLRSEVIRALQQLGDETARTKKRVESNEGAVATLDKTVKGVANVVEEPIELYAGRGIQVHKLGEKRFRFELDPAITDSAANPIDYSYVGPFAVKQTDDSVVDVYSTESSGIPSYIILGLSTIEFNAGSDKEVTGINANGWIYLDITYSSGYSATAAFISQATGWKTQTNDHIYHPLAYVTYASGAIVDIVQLHYGIVHFPGRAL